jgi:hypothetical protein
LILASQADDDDDDESDNGRVGDGMNSEAGDDETLGIPLNPAAHSDVNLPPQEGLQPRLCQHRVPAGLSSI